MYQVHKDHAFAENPMEREDEEVTVKLEGENMDCLKEVTSCICPVSDGNCKLISAGEKHL